MREDEIVFKSGDIELKGTLCMPDAAVPCPAVLLIPGSGQVDRDENHKKLRINFFKEVAVHLAASGIATFRYDKRGVGSSGGDYWTAGFYDNVEDAGEALKVLHKHNEIDGKAVFLLGHSEGALISTRLAASGADVAGIILVAGSARPGEDVLKWQAEQVVKGMKGFNKWLIKLLRIDVARAQQKQLDKIKKSTKDTYRVQLIARLNARWMRQFMAYNPADDLPGVQVPVLAITGEKDIQTSPDDLAVMAELVRSDFTYHLVPGLTHILRIEEDEPSLSHYKKLAKRPTSPIVLELVSEWLQNMLKISR